MAVDFERMSSNIIDIIDEILNNKKLVNYIGYNADNPSLQNVQPKTIAPSGVNEKIFPYPFDDTFTGDVRTQIHIYYPNIDILNNGNVAKTALNFDIVVNKKIWLLKDNGKKIIRPYQIAKYLYESFHGKKVGGLGTIHFLNGSHTMINSEFEGLRLIATFTEF